ncbi:MAG: anti-sigma factor antagonist [Clostridia bacterium]|nr:anti-sigma factor antagonist [Clostridia bacterium]
MNQKVMEGSDVRCELVGGQLHIAITGEIDHHNARSLRAKIDEKLYFYRPKLALLDVSEVSFMDSSGLGLILGRFTLTRELGGELRVINPSDSVGRILDLAGTSRLITIEKKEVKNHEENPAQ